MSRVIHYFAYGSNMNPERVEQRGLRIVDARAGRLTNFQLMFNKMSRDHAGVGHANIEYRHGAETEGVLYELADFGEIHKMDPFERAPWNYGREAISIQHNNGSTWAWTYFANPAVKQTGLVPPREYLAHLLAGEQFLSPGYLATLRQLYEALD